MDGRSLACKGFVYAWQPGRVRSCIPPIESTAVSPGKVPPYQAGDLISGFAPAANDKLVLRFPADRSRDKTVNLHNVALALRIAGIFLEG
jgi:hypothetical protein